MDPVFASALRDRLVAIVEEKPHVRRRRRHWRLGIGMLASSTALAGGVAFAAGLLTQPGAPRDTPLGSIVTVTRTGTATVGLGPAPAKATNVSLTLTCLTVGTFGYPDGSSMTCSPADLAKPPPIAQTSIEVMPLRPGEHSVTITADPNASWTLQAVYINRVTTSWATNANGQTYGVPNYSGLPDLAAVSFDGGMQQGYVKASDLDCASGQSEIHSPAEALAWSAASKNRNVSIPVYKSDGVTVIGTFTAGGASGPDAHTVPVASLYKTCSAGQTGDSSTG
jgi:hypothetical protein